MIVMGLLEREGRARAGIIKDTKRPTLARVINANIEPGANVYTDDFTSYMGTEKEFAHAVVNHVEAYVNGIVHTDGIENFWSCLKRTLGGTYIRVEPAHLTAYVDERAWRFNNCEMKDQYRLVFPCGTSLAAG